MKRCLVVVITALIAAFALVSPASAVPGQVTHDCTSFGSLPPGPPPKVGQTTVVTPSGKVQTPPLVPGPCSAAGFLKGLTPP
jgi:hypothetical protein